MDRESAYERLAAKLRKAPEPAADEDEPARKTSGRKRSGKAKAPREQQSTAEKVIRSGAFKQAARSAAAVVGREIARSIFGSARPLKKERARGPPDVSTAPTTDGWTPSTTTQRS